MSRNATVAAALLILCAAIALVIGHPASSTLAVHPKDSDLRPAHQPIIHTSKLTIPASAKLEILDEVQLGQEFTLSVRVRRESLRDDYSYELQLGRGLGLVIGRSQDTLYWEPDQLEQTLTFKLRQNSKRSERIGFLLRADNSGHKQRFSIGSLDYHQQVAAQEAMAERQKVFLSNNPEALELQKRAARKHLDGHDH